MTVFVCGRRAPAAKCTASGCREALRTTACQFELTGHKTGQKCERAICREHCFSSRPGSSTDKRPMCRTHHQMTIAAESR